MAWIDPDLHGYGFGVACPWCWLREILRRFTIAGRFLNRWINDLASLTWTGLKHLAAKNARRLDRARSQTGAPSQPTATIRRKRARMTSFAINIAYPARLFGFALLLAFVTIFAALFAGMAGYSVLTSILPPKAPLWNDVRCALGLPLQADAKCWQDRVQRLESQKARELATVRTKNKHLDKLRAEAAARLKSIGTLEERFDVVNLFKESRVGRLTVMTGVQYRGLTSGPEWTRAWCYTEITDGGVALKVTLAEATPRRGVVRHSLTAAESRKLGGINLTKLVDHCQWPDGTS